MNERQMIGKMGEMKAMEYLDRKGYVIISKNYRCKSGEIDIIALKNGVTCFIEVKTRSSLEYGFPCQAVTYRKQKRIRSVALYYIQHEIGNDSALYQFDVIEILVLNNSKYFINHIENAF